MPRDTDRPDPYVSAPLGPPIRQAAPAPAPSPAPLKAPQPATMTEADVPMIIRDCYAKPSKMEEPVNRISVKAAGALSYKDGVLNMDGWHWHAEGPGPWTQRHMAVLALEHIIEQIKQDPHESCDVLIGPMVPKPIPTKLNDQQHADWLRMSAESLSFTLPSRYTPHNGLARMVVLPSGALATTPELHPRRHLDWPVIAPDMIEQAPKRRAAWLPEGE